MHCAIYRTKLCCIRNSVPYTVLYIAALFHVPYALNCMVSCTTEGMPQERSAE